ncbi:MAG: VIT domain-containing protein [Desulfobacteraceae bacterium]
MDLKPTPNPSAAAGTCKKPMNAFIGIYVALFGVLLPLITLGYELATQMCAAAFFDPIPTGLHVALVVLVPLSNLMISISAMTRPILQKWHGPLNGMAMGISGFYTLLFLPMLPLSVVAVMFMGLGLLPLSPVLSLAAVFLCRRAIRIHTPSKKSGLWQGVAVALGLLIIFEMPVTLTRVGMQMAASASENTRINGIHLLRRLGSREKMLRMCYQRPGMATDMVGFFFSLGSPVFPSEARRIFYRVEGVPFNSLAPPKLSGVRSGPLDDVMFDAGLGGDAVDGRIKGLSLNLSRIDGSVDPDAALSYVEWTLSFENYSQRQREARAVVALPPSGVVSRLTLWIDGRPQEAAFGARRKVRQAYQAVVHQNRDPVLVTTKGPDRILVQCFPVLPGQQMKIRLGITAPLYGSAADHAVMILPHFTERNFSIPARVRHHLWVESEKPIHAPAGDLIMEHPQDHRYAVRGEISNARLVEDKALIQIKPYAPLDNVWAEDPPSQGKFIIRQRIVDKEIDKPAHVLFLIDGSRGMQPFIRDIVESLKRFPTDMSAEVLVAGDGVAEIIGPERLRQEPNLENVARRLLKRKFKGGCDNVRALDQAWERLAPRPDSILIWIHGVQPVALTPADFLQQKWERRPQSPVIYDLQVENGPNLVVRDWDRCPSFIRLPVIHHPGKALEELFDAWRGGKTYPGFVRQRFPRVATEDLDAALKTSSHLARLWACRRIAALSSSGRGADLEKAAGMAVDYQLVTPVSGAVVLENARQYEGAGLQPVDPATVPTIPEPDVWMLIIIVLGVFAALVCRKAGLKPWRCPWRPC